MGLNDKETFTNRGKSYCFSNNLTSLYIIFRQREQTFGVALKVRKLERVDLFVKKRIFDSEGSQ